MLKILVMLLCHRVIEAKTAASLVTLLFCSHIYLIIHSDFALVSYHFGHYIFIKCY